MPTMLNSQSSRAVLLAARWWPGSGCGRRPSSRSARRSCGRRSRPSRSASQASFCSAGSTNSGYIVEVRLGLDRDLDDELEVLRVLVDAAEPAGVRHRLDARARARSAPGSDRQRLDDRRSCGSSISRSAPARSTPHAEGRRGSPPGRPNSTKATRIESSVKAVRSFLRLQVAPEQRQVLHAAGSVDEDALVEVERCAGRAPRRAGRG